MTRTKPHTRARVAIVAAAMALMFTALVPTAPARAATTQLMVNGLSLPVFVTHAPGDPYRIYIVEKRGRIKILDLRDPGAGTTLFLDITNRVVNVTQVFDERGLLGLAFHPDHKQNGLFYVNYINTLGSTQISGFTRSGPDTADPDSEQFVLNYSQPQTNHNGGWMAFGPDGYLYIASGDGGGSNDNGIGHNPTFGNGQDLNTLLGKMLRIDVNGDDFPADVNRNYAVPADNPFVGVAGLDEIWAYGLRNPWRNSFDRQTDALYIADVGQGNWEEINHQPASSAGGENYGWRCYEGNAAFNTSNCPGAGTLTFPFFVYPHTGALAGCSITGGYAYRGCAIPEFDGLYFFADYCSSRIFSLRYTGGGPPAYTDFVERTSEFAPPVGSISAIVSFGEDFFGELYIVTHSTTNGAVWKVVPEDPITDCNNNNIEDACEIAAGIVDDLNGNGVPDECFACPGDANGDEFVDFNDITAVLANWLADYTPGTGPGDANLDGVVDFNDITTILANWLAPCP